MVMHLYTYAAILLVCCCLSQAEWDLDHACFNGLLDINCRENEVIVFENARYGRNDSIIAQRCATHYYKNCEFDVTLTLNRNCAGKQKCQLHVNTELFGDPCGYEEFLIVKYQCIPRTLVSDDCPDSDNPPLYTHGFIASPNYPQKYYRDSRCQWELSVQKRQKIRVTILDFEMDATRNGRCTDYLKITAGERVYFENCGVQGPQIIDIDGQQALVEFGTDISSLTNRGFFAYFEGIGPGCRDLDDLHLGSAESFMKGDTLYANASCEYGYVFEGTVDDFLLLECKGDVWSPDITQCIAIPPMTSPGPLPSITLRDETKQDPTAAIGVVLGIISALLLLSLLLILILYYKKSRTRHRQEKADQWRVVVNNFKENERNEYNEDHCRGCSADDTDDDLSPTCNIAKATKRKQNNYNDSTYKKGFYDEDEYMLDYNDMHGGTPAKSIYDVPPQPKLAMSRKNSKASVHKQYRVGDRLMEVPTNTTICSECGHNSPKSKKRRPHSQRDLRSKRKSQHCVHNRSAAQSPYETEVPIYGFPTQITQSAPDLLQLECPQEGWTISPDEPYAAYAVPPPQSVQTTPYHNGPAPNEDPRRATLGAPTRAKQKLQYIMADDDQRC